MSKFAAPASLDDDSFKAATVGLVTIAEFRDAARLSEAKTAEAAKAKKKAKKEEKRKAKLRKKRRSIVTNLSFAVNEDEEEEEAAVTPSAKGKEGSGTGAGAGAGAGSAAATAKGSPKPTGGASPTVVKKRSRKDPSVRTDFLPDREREERERELREKLKKEWIDEQERVKREKLQVTYSYWDGSGHRREIVIPKGVTIGKFLEWVRQDLAKEFHELRSISAENLLYIKEDLIIPSHFSFYDLIVTKARGKSGPLFAFDVHDDVRLLADARVEKDESHPGKIVERHWYERNKHIFPASRWEVYDPSIKRDKYTIHGDEIQTKKKKSS